MDTSTRIPLLARAPTEPATIWCRVDTQQRVTEASDDFQVLLGTDPRGTAWSRWGCDPVSSDARRLTEQQPCLRIYRRDDQRLQVIAWYQSALGQGQERLLEGHLIPAAPELVDCRRSIAPDAESILAQLPVHILVIDRQGKVQQRHGSVGDAAFELPTEAQDIAAGLLAEVLNSGEAQVFQFAQGSAEAERYYEAQLQALDDERILVICRDISQSKRSQLRLAEQNNDQQSAVADKQTFLAQIGHDFVTLTAGIVGSLELIDGTRLDCRQRDLLENAQRNARRHQDLILDMLDIAEFDSDWRPFRLETVDLPQLLRQSGEHLDQRSDVAIAIEVVGDAALILADSDRLQRLLTALLRTVHDRHPASDLQFLLHTQPAGEQHYEITLSVGLKQVDLAAIPTEDFLDHERQAADWILNPGLPIARHLASLMGLELRYSPNDWEHTCFRLSGRFDTATHRGNGTTNPSCILHHRSVLVVEDDSALQTVLIQLVRSLGGHCRLAADGLEAVQLATLDHFDLILMDCNLPRMGGLQATQHIRDDATSLNRETPICGISALTGSINRQRCRQAGMDEFLAKPLQRQSFIEACLTLLRPGPARPPLPESDIGAQEDDMDEEPLIDTALIQQTLELMGNDGEAKQVFRDLQQTVADELPEFFAHCDQASAASDHEGIANQAHRLKGRLGMLGARRAQLVAAKLEQSARPPHPGIVDDVPDWQCIEKQRRRLATILPASLDALAHTIHRLEPS